MLQEIDMTTHRPSLRKVLLLGSYGAGKTHFIGTAPKPCAVFSFDRGYDTIAMTPGVKVISILEDDRQFPKAWQQFRLRWQQFIKGEQYTWPDGRKEPYKTVALDSLTFLSEICMNHYQYMGQNVDKKATFTQYQQILENMTDIVNDAKRLANHVICTALIKIEKDELSGETLSLPAMIGSIRDNIGAQFDAVFYMYTDKTPQGVEVFRMKTVGGYREKAKLRLPANIRSVMAPTITDPNFMTILKMIEERVESVYGEQLTIPPVESAPVEQPAASAPAPKAAPLPAQAPARVAPSAPPKIVPRARG